MGRILKFLLSVALPLLTCADTLLVRSLDGEKWWGGATLFGRDQPYVDCGERDQNLDNFCNQIAPFFVSSAGRYIWSEKPLKWCAKGGNLTLESTAKIELVQAGATLKEAFLAAAKAHFPPTGTIPDELFFTRPQYNHGVESYYTGMTQESVEKYVRAIVDHGFPIGVVIVDDGWEKDFGTWEFKPGAFPRPREMTDKLHALGAKVMLWVVPYISPDSLEGLSLCDKGYVLRCHAGKNSRGNAAIVRWWSGYSFAYDLSAPGTLDYLTGKLNGLMKDYGIDGFKFDGADLPHYTLYGATSNVFSRPGYTAADNCRDWSLFASAYRFNEMRASYNTAGQPLVQRLQDKAHSWEDLRALVPDMLAAGILGYAYTCADMIGGGLIGSFLDPEFHFDKKIMIRSCQAHALMPMMQFSIAPWRVLNEADTAICRAAAELHVTFAPRILDLAKHASKTGEPIVRLMEYEFPHQGLADCRDQFMLGGDWLVAPVLNADDSRIVRLPAGAWTDDLGKTYEGPQTLELTNVPLERLPRYRKVR